MSARCEVIDAAPPEPVAPAESQRSILLASELLLPAAAGAGPHRPTAGSVSPSHAQPLPAATKLRQHCGMARGRIVYLTTWQRQPAVQRFSFTHSDRLGGSTMRAAVAA
jgi:hypothetical protein